MKNRFGSILTYIAQAGVLFFGLSYLIRSSYMPYHAEAVNLPWEEVPPAFQRLIWTYMKAASGGWIALGVVFIYLQYKFNQNKEAWIPYLILVGGLIFGAISLYAAIGLRMTTPANAPVLPVAVILTFLLIGFYFNLQYSKSK